MYKKGEQKDFQKCINKTDMFIKLWKAYSYWVLEAFNVLTY